MLRVDPAVPQSNLIQSVKFLNYIKNMSSIASSRKVGYIHFYYIQPSNENLLHSIDRDDKDLEVIGMIPQLLMFIKLFKFGRVKVVSHWNPHISGCAPPAFVRYDSQAVQIGHVDVNRIVLFNSIPSERCSMKPKFRMRI